MRKIQTKFILIFIGIVVIPLFPLAWLVNGLVLEGYQLGVNPQVETVLENSVGFSQEIYQTRKVDLANQLEGMIDHQLSRYAGREALPSIDFPDTNDGWQWMAYQVRKHSGPLIFEKYQQGVSAENASLGNASFIDRLREADSDKQIIANRGKNLFIALERRTAGTDTLYFSLAGKMTDEFLTNSDHVVDVLQLYRTMTLSPESIFASFQKTFLFIALVILVIAVVVAIWLSRRITRPLAALVTGTEELGRGNLDYRISQTTNDEIGELVQHFNRMGSELKESQERAIYLEKMAAWQEIARRLAHEIKNPLTPIQLTIQEMVDQYEGKDQDYAQLLQECHGIIREEIDNLRRLVREFSDFGRLPELQRSPGDINALIRDVEGLYTHRKIDSHLAESLPEINFDEDRIRRVLINLIENAAQADPKEQPISITSQLENEGILITVEDKGTGVSAEIQEKIFEPYFTTKNNGIGLGLAITRKMVEEHGGNISLDSTPGKGSTFSVWLPA